MQFATVQSSLVHVEGMHGQMHVHSQSTVADVEVIVGARQKMKSSMSCALLRQTEQQSRELHLTLTPIIPQETNLRCLLRLRLRLLDGLLVGLRVGLLEGLRLALGLRLRLLSFRPCSGLPDLLLSCCEALGLCDRLLSLVTGSGVRDRLLCLDASAG